MIKNKFIIQTPLFHKCHLNCGFCMERVGKTRENIIDYEYIKNLPLKSYNLYKDWIANNKPSDIYLEICGGEIFMVGLPEKLYDLYEYYIEETTKILKENFPFIQNVFIEWDTSLLYINTNKLNYMLSKYGGKINTSYDSIDRFNSESMKNLWFSLVQKYKSYIGNIEFVFFKQGIQSMINDPFIEKLREYELNASWYLPVNDDYAERMPNDDLLFNFLKWGIDNRYFNIIQIRECIKTITNPNDVVNYCDCFESNEHANDPVIELNCFKSVIDKEFFRDENTLNRSFIQQLNYTNEIRGCMYCEYNGRCQKMCAAIVNSKYYSLNKECPFKSIYNYIESNKYIIKDYERIGKNDR